MKNTCVLTLVFLIAGFFVFFSCSPKEQGDPSGLGAVFAEAGVRFLEDKVSARDFSLPMVPAAGAQANQQTLPPPLLQSNADALSLGSFRGNVVLINFWATWCAPCRAEKPSMQAIYERYSASGFTVLAVNVMERENLVVEFKESFGLSFPSVLDQDGRVSASFGVQALPTSFLIDKEGYIIMRLVGSTDWDRPEIHRLIETLLQ
jgi:thiol-disulfide isomerase/thioredoxin